MVDRNTRSALFDFLRHHPCAPYSLAEAMTHSLYELNLPTEAIDALRNEFSVTEVEELHQLLKVSPSLMTQWLLKFQLDYSVVLKVTEPKAGP